MIYLDNASTTFPKPPEVVRAVEQFLLHQGVSPGRGGYAAARAVERMVSEVRLRLARLVGASVPERMLYTASCSDALNMALHGVLQLGDHVVTTALEHNSVNRPLEALCDAGVVTLTRVPPLADGCIAAKDIGAAIKPNTRLITLNHASNVTGVIQPAAEIGALARERGVLLLLDAAQTAGLLDIKAEAWGVDLLAFPAHKELLAPAGLGLLYVDPRVDLKPWRMGGTGGDSASRLQPETWPHRHETGTHNAPAIAGLRAALDGLDPAGTLQHLRDLIAAFIEQLPGLTRVHIVGPADVTCRVGTVSLTVDGLDASDVGAILDQSFGIAVRSGLQCAPYAHRALGTFPEGTIRVSPGPWTTQSDMRSLVQALRQITS